MEEQLFVGNSVGEATVLHWTMESVHSLQCQGGTQGTAGSGL